MLLADFQEVDWTACGVVTSSGDGGSTSLKEATNIEMVGTGFSTTVQVQGDDAFKVVYNAVST